MRRLGESDKIALLMHEQLATGFGKLGQGMLRYSNAEICAVIDKDNVGASVEELTGIRRNVPIVGTVNEGHALGSEILVIGIAPPGGILPEGWWQEILLAAELGMSIVNPLHCRWEGLLEPNNGAWVWDVRVEPERLAPATGAALGLNCLRVLTVGSDMSVGKMTASIELARAIGSSAKFVATGQVGMCISGDGVPLDAVRLDYAAGSIEMAVKKAAKNGARVVVIEGQGSLGHPASTATLALMRGSMPTHLLFVHRARQTELKRMAGFAVPDIGQAIQLNEDLAAACSVFPRPRTIGVALNCAELSDSETQEECSSLEKKLRLPVADPVKHGCARFVSQLFATSDTK